GIRDFHVTGVQTCALPIYEIITPFQGAPLVDKENGLYSIYRFHIKDPIYFQENIKVTVQQIGFGLNEPAIVHYGEDFVNYRAMEIGRASCRERVERGGCEW